MRRAVCVTIGSLALLAIAYGEPATDKRFCADSNGDGIVDLSDAVTVLNYLFMADSREPYCVQENQSIDALTTRIAELETALSVSQARPSFPTCAESPDRFVDNGDGTVTDTCTNLMWQKEIADPNGNGIGDSEVWNDGLNYGDAVPWDYAVNYCEELNFASHDDWRLPNIWELQSLIDYRRGTPDGLETPLPEIFGIGFTCWSSTSHHLTTTHAWRVHFFGPVANIVDKTDHFFIRAVRNP